MRTITVTGTTLFAIALQYFGDATQWDRIADLNGITDPWLSGLQILRLPDMGVSAGGQVGS